MKVIVGEALELAKEIIKCKREKTYKDNKDYEVIIDLSYFISTYKQNVETVESKRILENLQNGYYGVYKRKVVKEQEYKLVDNIQYSFL
ncbi:hypothetical protein [uncultured Clostridium sp.]|jgi:hypothetical protein|uniref:hypothetical protein n=1 Tax=uncultured Clostridium sp. TaxID=59620 RepID=UPI00260F7DA0|nr:hypothetical protein [uncultured Clostridium sp.]MCI9110596.1 hypothetical protein [Bacilli bacterium]